MSGAFLLSPGRAQEVGDGEGGVWLEPGTVSNCVAPDGVVV